MKKSVAKLLAFLIIFSALLSACSQSSKCKEHIDNDRNSVCDICSDTVFIDYEQSSQADSQSGSSGADSQDSSKGPSGSHLGSNQQGSTSGQTSSNACKGHRDGDDNGVCDLCATSVIVYFDFYSINDLHGKFDDTDDNIGVDELTTYLENAKKANRNCVFLSAGDMWQGSSESNMTKGLIMTDWMNELDFAAMALGNHEYDWGQKYIEENEELAEFPFLAINVYDRKTNAIADYCEPSVMIDSGSVQIGIIGAIGDCYSSIAVDKCAEVYFKTGRELTSLVKKESERLKSKGADFIVYLLHDGYGKTNTNSITSVSSSQISSYYDTSLSNGYIDLVFEGHSHQGYRLKDEYGVYHLQNRGDNKGGISRAEVSINSVTLSHSVHSAELVSIYQYQNLSDHPLVDKLLLKYDDLIAPSKDVLGYNKSSRNSEQIKQIVADLYYKKGVEQWGKKYDIVLGGGFMSVRSPYNLERGDVTYSQLQSLLPFDNQLVLCSISGLNLKRKFFETSNSDYFISYGSYGKTVRENINLNKTYYIVVDTYSAYYAPNKLTVVEKYDETTFARDLLAEHIKGGGLS
ncbi:MAG: bifunctional metallophosphatase/5'-nucleotidase [Ruminococcaceae bacterium]|nr:bifunctional metallophosphatase/5'-nucleotidase [Oscillospiraceae bacterium]